MGKFEIYRDVARQYRWRLKATNGEIIAVSEAYVAKQSAINSVTRVKVLAPRARVVDLSALQATRRGY